MADQSNTQAQYAQKRALATTLDGQQTDARISKDGLIWHFRNIAYKAKSELNHLEFQLKYSRDMDGTSHTPCVEAILANMREHIAAMEAFIREQAE